MYSFYKKYAAFRELQFLAVILPEACDEVIFRNGDLLAADEFHDVAFHQGMVYGLKVVEIVAAVREFGGVHAVHSTATAPLGAAYVAMGNNDMVSLLLTFFLGWTGIHRMYMGSTPWMWILYLLTGGGFGVVVLLDFVFELIGFVDGSGLGKYYDNPNILMWL